MTRKWLVGVGVVLLIVVVWLVYDERQTREFDILYEHCRKLQVGMDKEQVLTVMGDPKRISFVPDDSLTAELWYYADHALMSMPMTCSFDSATGRVIGFSCGER